MFSKALPHVHQAISGPCVSSPSYLGALCLLASIFFLCHLAHSAPSVSHSLWNVSQILYLGARLQAHAKIQAIRPYEAMIGSPVVAIRIKDGRVRQRGAHSLT